MFAMFSWFIHKNENIMLQILCVYVRTFFSVSTYKCIWRVNGGRNVTLEIHVILTHLWWAMYMYLDAVCEEWVNDVICCFALSGSAARHCESVNADRTAGRKVAPVKENCSVFCSDMISAGIIVTKNATTAKGWICIDFWYTVLLVYMSTWHSAMRCFNAVATAQ